MDNRSQVRTRYAPNSGYLLCTITYLFPLLIGVDSSLRCRSSSCNILLSSKSMFMSIVYVNKWINKIRWVSNSILVICYWIPRMYSLVKEDGRWEGIYTCVAGCKVFILNGVMLIIKGTCRNPKWYSCTKT